MGNTSIDVYSRNSDAPVSAFACECGSAMTAHQDVAGLVAELRANAKLRHDQEHLCYADGGIECDVPLEQYTEWQAADRLESLSQALREAEDDVLRLHNEKMDRLDRALVSESRLAAAMRVIEPFAKLATQYDESLRSGECHSWIDFLIDFHWPSEGNCTAARAFIAGNGGKDE
jgi:hypothetical protein